MKLHSSLTCFIFIIQLIVCNAWKSRIENTNTLVIEMEQETDPAFPVDLNYTGYKYIELQNPKLNVLTAEMQSTISKMVMFEARNGRINSVHLMAQFSWVIIFNCSTREVVINPNWTYQASYLWIVYGNLAKLPKHLNVMKNLEQLHLHGNEIEFVEMAEFNGLNKLKELGLQYNKIAEIRETLQNPAILPKLEIFSVHENHLVDVNFEHWNTTSLKEMSLRDNQLQIALSFPSAFLALSRVIIKNNPFNCEWLTSTVKELKARGNVLIISESDTKCDKNGPPLDELVRRVKLKETFATIPFLNQHHSKLEDNLKNRMMHLEAINQTVTANNAQQHRQNVSLRDSYNEMQAKFSDSQANIENFRREVKNQLMQITKEATTNEQRINATLKNMEISTNFEIHNITKAINLESNKNYNLLQTKNEKLEDQIRAFSAKAEDLQTEMANITLQLESLQNSILNETESLELHQKQELMTLRQQMATLENERKADHQQFKQIMDEVQHQLNASSIGTEDSAYSGVFKLERYSAIVLVIGVFSFLFLTIIMAIIVKRRNPTEGRDIFKSDVPVASFMDDPQQTGEHIYDSLNYHL